MLEAQFPRTLTFWRTCAECFYERKGSTALDARLESNRERFAAWSREELTRKKLLLIGVTALTVNQALTKTEAGIIAILPEEIVIELPEDFGATDELMSAIHFRVSHALTLAFSGAMFPFRLQPSTL